MKPLAFPLLADENIHGDVVKALIAEGRDVLSVCALGLVSRPDVEIIRRAHADGRVVLSHDSDFGKLVIQDGEPFTGIVYLRPGHISAQFVLEILTAIDKAALDVTPPFLLVAERKMDTVRIRLRSAKL